MFLSYLLWTPMVTYIQVSFIFSFMGGMQTTVTPTSEGSSEGQMDCTNTVLP